MSSARLRFGVLRPSRRRRLGARLGSGGDTPPTEAFPWRTGHGRVALIIDVTQARHRILPITED